jgi:aspartate aminotransferase-like enzyme
MQKRYLLAPGPTAIPPEVLLKMAEPIIHHRNPLFEEVMADVREGLKYLFGTKNEVLILTSSGTGAMEGAVTNMLAAGDTALCVRSGKFGERWTEICQAYGIEAKNLDIPWGDELDPAQIEKILKTIPGIRAVYMQATETSTGARFPVKEVAAIVGNFPETILVVDGITGVGVFELPMDEWGIDVLISGSQKALMLPPGLAFAGVSDKAWAASKRSNLPRFYFNWAAELKNLRKNQTNFTPAISLIIGLRESLRIIREEGLENVFKRIDLLARATREGAMALGLEIFGLRGDRRGWTGPAEGQGLPHRDVGLGGQVRRDHSHRGARVHAPGPRLPVRDGQGRSSSAQRPEGPLAWRAPSGRSSSTSTAPSPSSPLTSGSSGRR